MISRAMVRTGWNRFTSKKHRRRLDVSYRRRYLRLGLEGLEPRLLLASDLLIADAATDSILRFDGASGAPLGAFVASGSGGLVDPLDPEFGPDGNLYVISNKPDNVKVLRYDGSSGAFLGTFIDTGDGGFNSGSAIEFGPDGNLYIATISETGVLRFDGITGNPLGVAANGQGIRRASGLDFGADGLLYVVDSDRTVDSFADRVLRFDPETSAFVDQFVPPGTLDDAVFLTFGPDGHLYASDVRPAAVRRFSGVSGDSLGVFTRTPNQARSPIFDIQFGPDGNAYASTAERILRFDSESGEFLDVFVDSAGGSIVFFPPDAEEPPINLAVTDIQSPVGVVQGRDLSITYTVANLLPVGTVGHWVDVVYLSSDGVFDPQDTEMGRVARASGIGAKSSYIQTLTARMPLIDAGDYQLIVVADRRGEANDSERQNNIFVSGRSISVVPSLGLSHDPTTSIAVGRTLSTYTTSGLATDQDIVLHYTVYNRTSSEVDGTLLVTTLATDVTLASSSVPPNQRGSELSWSLGKIIAFGSATVELTVKRGASSPLQLDNGPRAYATIDGVAITDDLPLAKLRTDPVDPVLLSATVDADSADPFVLAKAAELDQDPEKIFGYLSEDVAFEAYAGSLRGARGTLWSGAGNTLDKSSLGVALLRASGVPARYAQGLLPQATAGELILSMFPNPLRVTGFVPVGANIADPASDALLLQESQNHFWIQFDDGAGFGDADTSFKVTRVGQTLTAATATFGEIPDEMRHRVTVRLNVEKYSQATALFGLSDGLNSQTVLEEVFPAVQLVGRPLTVGNYVSSDSISAPVVTAVTHTYLPYIRLGDEAFDMQSDALIRDRTFQEVFTNFPFGSEIITGLFLELDVQTPGEPTEFLTRTLFDRIGFAARQGNTTATVTSDPNGAPSINNFDLFTIGLRAGARSSDMVFGPGLAGDAYSNFEAFAIRYNAATLPNQAALDAEAINRTRDLLIAIQRVKLAQFEAESTALTQSIERVSLVRTYLNRPRLSIASSTVEFDENLSSALSFQFDLRSTRQRVIAAPGQNASIVPAFNLQRGFLENEIEGGLFDSGTRTASRLFNKTVSVTSIFEAAEAQNVPLLSLLPGRTRDVDALRLSAEAKSRISLAVTNGNLVVVPGQMIELNGQQVVGWYEINPLTGETIGVLEDGTHGINELVTEFAIALGQSSNPGFRLFGGFIAGFLGSNVEVQLIKLTINSARSALPQFAEVELGVNIKNAVATLRTARLELISGKFANLLVDKFFAAGFAAGLLAGYFAALDPPLSGALYDPVTFLPQRRRGIISSSISANQPIGAITASLGTESLVADGSVAATWTSNATTAVMANAFSVANGEILLNGVSLGQGNISLESKKQTSLSVTGNVAYNFVGDGKFATYSSAISGLGVGGSWDHFDASLIGTAEVSLFSGDLSLNGADLPAANYTIRTTNAVFSGSGPSTTPDFIGAVTLNVSRGTLAIGPSDRDVLMGGVPFDTSQGISLTNYEGIVSITDSGILDTVQLTGTSSNVLRVFSTPASLTVEQNRTVQLDIGVVSSLTSTYVMQVEAPAGWDAHLDNTGRVTLKPVAGVQAGSFNIRLSAQSLADPNLVAHTVVPITVTSTAPQLNLNVAPDDLVFLPINGAQVRTSYRATIQNLGPTTETFDLSTFNAPQGFDILASQSSVVVPAGETAIIGLYLQPSGPLPSPGTATFFDITVTGRNDGKLSETVSVPFTVPEIHGLRLLTDPVKVTTSPGVPIELVFVVESTGNVDEHASFDVNLSSGLVLAGLTNTTVVRGERQVQRLTLTPDNATPLNSELFVTITTRFGTDSPVTLRIPVLVAAPGAGAATEVAVFARGFLDNVDLADRLDELSMSLTNLIQEPASEVFKRQSLSALDSIVSLLAQVENLSQFVEPLTASRIELDAAFTPTKIQAAVNSLGIALDSFAETVFNLSEHNLEVFLNPNNQVAQPQSPTQFELRIHNTSTSAASTTYNLVLANLPAGVTGILSQNSVTLGRNEFASVTVTLTPTSLTELSAIDFAVTVSADGFPDVAKTVRGSLTSRREFVSIVSVTAAPPFADVGSMVDVSARVLNAVNREQLARASFVVRDSTGTQVRTPSTPVDVALTVQTSLVTVPLGSINTTGLANGNYSILLTLTDRDGVPIPGATGLGSFLVGSPLTTSITASPDVLPPGTSTVTNTLDIKAIGSFEPQLDPLTVVGQVPISGGLRGVATRNNIAYTSGTNGIQVIDYSNPASPSVVGTIPGNHFAAVVQDNVLLALRPSGPSFILDVYALQNTPLAPTLIGSSPVINYNLASDLKANSTHAFVGQFNVCFFLGSRDIYHQAGDLISLALNLDNAANPTVAAPTLDNVLSNTHGDNAFDPTDVSGCAENGGDHNVFGIALVNPQTAYLATTSVTGGDTQAGVGRIQIVDVTVPATAKVIRELDVPGTVVVLGVGVSGNIGVVVGSTQGFQDNPNGVIIGNLTVTTLDVSDPLNPRIVTSRVLDRITATFWVNFVTLGNGLFAFSNTAFGEADTTDPAVIIIDASNPRSPLIGQSDIPAELVAANSLSTDGKFLFTSDTGGVTIYRVNPLPGLPVTARVQIPNGTGVSVIPGSFNVPPSDIIAGSSFDTYVFDLTLSPALISEKLVWQSTVTRLQPGESRPVTLGTTIDFAFQGDTDQVTLPRTSVVAEQVLSLTPGTRTVKPGEQAAYSVVLANPSSVAVTYDLSVSGVPNPWVEIDSSIVVPAGGSAAAILRLTSDPFDVVGDYGFVVNAIVDGVTTSVTGTLTLQGAPSLPDAQPQSQGVVVTLTPATGTAGQGTAATYVARVFNVGSQTDDFKLTLSGLPAGFQSSFTAGTFTVPPGASNFRDVQLTIIPPGGTTADDYPFTVTAVSSTNIGNTGVTNGSVTVLSSGVSVDVTPDSGDPNSTFQLRVTNTGQVADTFDLSLAAPAALVATLATTSLTLAPGQSQSVTINVGTIDFAFPGSISLIGAATSRSNTMIRAADRANVRIAGVRALSADFENESQTLAAPGNANFLLLVDNLGNLEDRYTATIASTGGPITGSLIGIDGQPAQSIPIFILPGLSRGAILLSTTLADFGQGTVTVQVRSLSNDTLMSEVTATLTAEAEVNTSLAIVASTADQAEGNVGNTPFTFTVTRSGNLLGATTVNFAVAGGSANFANAADFGGTLPSGQVSFAASESTKTITINVSGDTVVEPNEPFTVTLSAATGGATIATATANSIIRNDDIDTETGFRMTCAPLRVGVNRCTILGATPGGLVNLLSGVSTGTTFLTKFGVTVGIQDPTIIAQGIVQPDGRAVVQFNIENAALLSRIRLQAFEQAPIKRITNIELFGSSLQLDANRNGTVTALDALVVINQLSRDARAAKSSTASGEKAAIKPNDGKFDLDLNGDGIVSPLDALLVINHLSRQSKRAQPAGEMKWLAAPPIQSTTRHAPSELDEDLLQMLAEGLAP